MEAGVNLDKPVDEDAARLPLEVVLVRHVHGVGHRLALKVAEVLKDVVGILGDHEGIVEVFAVKEFDGLGNGGTRLWCDGLGGRGERGLLGRRGLGLLHVGLGGVLGALQGVVDLLTRRLGLLGGILLGGRVDVGLLQDLALLGHN